MYNLLKTRGYKGRKTLGMLFDGYRKIKYI